MKKTSSPLGLRSATGRVVKSKETLAAMLDGNERQSQAVTLKPEVPMAAENAVVIAVQEQKHLPGGRGSPGSAAKETATLRMPSPAFDPSLLLQKLGTGKTTQEYQAHESVFSQGDAADAVFYIESGKVKLTVVSKRGKEAVVAILPEKSFFGEGCLAGQPTRMSTACALHRAPSSGWKSSHARPASSGTGIRGRLSRLLACPEYSHGSGPGRSSL